MSILSPDSYEVFKELQAQSFRPENWHDTKQGEVTISNTDLAPIDGFFYRDHSYDLPDGRFLGGYEFGRHGDLWLVGSFSGAFTDMVLSIPADERTNIQHWPFSEKIDGARMGGTRQMYEFPSGQYVYFCSDYLIDGRLVGEEGIRKVGAFDRVGPQIYKGDYRVLVIRTS